MAIITKCDGCGKPLKVRDELAGRRSKCPFCGLLFTVEVPASGSEGPPELVSFAPLSFAILALGGVLALALFVGWLYGRDALNTERRVRLALTPSEKGRLEQQVAQLQGQVDRLRERTESAKARMAAADSELAEVGSAVESCQKQKLELEGKRREFVDLLAKLELKPSDVGVQGPSSGGPG